MKRHELRPALVELPLNRLIWQNSAGPPKAPVSTPDKHLPRMELSYEPSPDVDFDLGARPLLRDWAASKTCSTRAASRPAHQLLLCNR